MEIIRTVEWMKQRGREARDAGRIAGLAPTMGALHEGHLSLVRAALGQCSPVTVSIFVNPKQFGPSEDFQKYPRSFEADCAALEALGVDCVFAPDAEEMYPRGFCTGVSVEGLSERLEGRSRPGHFRGVTTVVMKLLEIVQPSIAFFGRKDAQQLRLIRQMAADLNLSAEIAECPIVREADGLALSSRNVYLRGEDRTAATALYRSLCAMRDEIAAGERTAARLVAASRRVLDAEQRVRLDYAELVGKETFEPLTTLHGRAYALLAGVVGSTRLIDNALIESDGPDGDGFRVII
ncbi:MAG TPA: pantoate--beta-alanine ligase [Candidatus Acidoferrales bacterium]|nr:pantoate--beta-alanine ligase [Candidatus Acidoferrales bacterium]